MTALVVFTNADMLAYIDGGHVQDVTEWKQIIVAYEGDPDGIAEGDLPAKAREIVKQRKAAKGSPYMPLKRQLDAFRAAQAAAYAPVVPPTVLAQPTMVVAPTPLQPIAMPIVPGVCPYCGYKNIPGAPFCNNCGKLQQAVQQQVLVPLQVAAAGATAAAGASAPRPVLAQPAPVPVQPQPPVQPTTRQQIGSAAATGVQTAFNLSVMLKNLSMIPGKFMSNITWFLVGTVFGMVVLFLIMLKAQGRF